MTEKEKIIMKWKCIIFNRLVLSKALDCLSHLGLCLSMKLSIQRACSSFLGYK